jgi:hypothetical protein
MTRHLTSTTVWGAFFSLLGGVGVLLPWAATGHSGGAIERRFTLQDSAAITVGTQTAHGWLTILVFAGALLLLIAARPMRPAPWWRTTALAVCGAAVLGIMAHYVMTVPTFEGWVYGGLMALIAGCGLLLVAVFEYRRTSVRGSA